MKRLIGAALLVAAMLALSACGGSHRIMYTVGPDLVHPTLPPPLWKPIRAEARDVASSLRGGSSVKTAQVYGPNSRYLLVKASSGDLVQKLASERRGFYLIVLHGHFVCQGCSRPHGSRAKPPRGKIATAVWSPRTGQTDFGIGNRPVAMSHLRGPTVIQVSGRKHSAYAYELPIDPNHPDNGKWSTLVRMHPVTVGYRIRGIFPGEWVVVAVKPLPQDGQQAAVRGWRRKRNPIWHGRLVLRSQSSSTSGPSNGPRPMPIGTRARIVPLGPAITRRLKHLHGAHFLSPTRLAFLTSGSGSCPSVPVRLVVQTPHAIRIDLAIGSWHRTPSGLRVQVPHLPPGGACLDNLVISPVVIAINPQQIDVHHRLRVSLYYRKGVIRSYKRPVVFITPPL